MLKVLFSNIYPSYIKILFDIIILILVFFITNQLIELPIFYSYIISSFFYVLISIVILVIFNSYNVSYRYYNIFDSFKLILGLIAASVSYILVIRYFNIDIELVNQLLLFFITFFSLSSFRILIKIAFSKINQNLSSIKNTMIFGAGNNGVLTKRAFFNNNEYKIVGFIDDDKSKNKKIIDGVKVFNFSNGLKKYLKEREIKKIIISTEKLTKNRLNFIYNYFNKIDIQIVKLPPLNSWIDGIPNINELKQVKVEELLSRGEIKIDNKKNNQLYNKKTILVTGAAGSIGKEIVNQLLIFKPEKIILYDNSETPMFHVKNTLNELNFSTKLYFKVGSVTDKVAVEKVFKDYKIDIVFHAAAYKHVNMMEENPNAAIINNVNGSKIVIDMSIKYEIDKFVLISSDKAINPTNVMGATKRLCELYLGSKIKDSKIRTKLITTRFGNVLGSNGSVVPIFEKQIEMGGPVTITHPDVVRYFMTIYEASQLVLEAATMGKGGEIFVFDMGNPVKIIDLAKNMITQKGLKYQDDIKVEYTGLRPGEKLYEELLLKSENLLNTHNKLIFIANKELVDHNVVIKIEKLIDLAYNSKDEMVIVKLMKEIIPEFISNQSRFEILDKK